MVAVVAVTGYHPINNSPDNPCEPAALSYTRTITLYKNYLLIVGLQVSWIQKSSLHVLTSSVITFTGKRTIIGSLTSPHLCSGDSRFRCLHSGQSDTWTLQIRYTQLRDMGEYQCQVNTEPKISMSVFLHVTGRLL